MKNEKLKYVTRIQGFSDKIRSFDNSFVSMGFISFLQHLQSLVGNIILTNDTISNVLSYISVHSAIVTGSPFKFPNSLNR